MHEYNVNILKVVDGDTVDVDIDLGFGVWLNDDDGNLDVTTFKDHHMLVPRVFIAAWAWWWVLNSRALCDAVCNNFYVFRKQKRDSQHHGVGSIILVKILFSWKTLFLCFMLRQGWRAHFSATRKVESAIEEAYRAINEIT